MQVVTRIMRFVMAVILCAIASPVWADFQAGYDAYERGDNVTAFREWKPLAEQGFANAQYNLGLMYDEGLGVTQDSAEAVKWFRKAAEQGNDHAQYNLGVMYQIPNYANIRYAGHEVGGDFLFARKLE